MKIRPNERGFLPLIIAVVVIAAIAIGGGIYVSSKKPKVKPIETTVNATSSTQVNGGLKLGTIRQLLNMGGNVACTIDNTTATSSVKGTAYISGSMMRVDFMVKGSSDTTLDSHMIRNGNDVYVWTGSQGVHMNINELASKSNANSSVNLDQNVNYSCSGWQKDTSQFVIPTSVKFIELPTINIKGNLNVKAGL